MDNITNVDQQIQILQALKKSAGHANITVNMMGEQKIVNNYGAINPINIREMCDNGDTLEALEVILTAMEDEDKIESLQEMALRIAMKKYKTNKAAAEWLGLGRTTFKEKMKVRNLLRPWNKPEENVKELKCVN